MKILIATPINRPAGGITRWGKDLSRYCKSHPLSKTEVVFYAMDRSTLIGPYLSPFSRLYLGIKEYVSHCLGIIKVFQSHKPDVFHLTSSASISLLKDLILGFVSKSLNIKCVIHFHFGRIPQIKQANGLEWKLLKLVAKIFDHIIVLDNYSYQSLNSSGIHNISIVANPIDCAIVDSTSVERHVSNRKEVLFVGHVIEAKGIFELVEVCQSIPDIQLKLIGPVTSETRKQVEQIVAEPQRLIIQGELPNEQIMEAMKSCSIFALPSHSEGFPYVILESMACGCAIVTTNVGAISKMLEEDKNGAYGIVVEPKNVTELRDAIAYMLNHPDFADECRNNARQRVKERYSMESVCSQLTSIWKGIVS